MSRRASVLLLIVILAAVLCCAEGASIKKEEKNEYKKLFSLFRRLMPVNQDPAVKGENGGIDCVGCTLAISVVEQLSQLHNKSVESVLDEICDWFPSPFSETCVYFVTTYGSTVITLLGEGLRPDDVCLALDICLNATCRLFPPLSSISEHKRKMDSKLSAQTWLTAWKRVHTLSKERGVDPWDWLKELFQSLINHRPLYDLDGDMFSTWDTLRGANWRGKDCDDFAGDIYPGRNMSDYTNLVDHNCNGIFGTNPQGKSYEDLFCKGTGQKGTIVIGDSAAAHFHIPVAYFDPRLMGPSTFNHLLDPFAEDEFDWPEKSWASAHTNNTYDGDVPGLTDSVYLRMRERNLCNHRDYQTLAVNGARSGSVYSGNITESIKRTTGLDHPALVFYALIGNDVCDGHHGFDTMTTVEEFEANVLESLNYLDSGVLPMGSNVVFVGLANGSLLYEFLHARQYPLSPEITYAEVYDYLNCLHLSPCWVWMNSNATVRNTGTQRAANLSAVYQKIINKYSFKNFDMAYLDFPILKVAAIWESMGGQFYQLIEPLDGFHPDQDFQALQARVIWEELEAKYPSFLSPVNPNNAQIKMVFGSQGGY